MVSDMITCKEPLSGLADLLGSLESNELYLYIYIAPSWSDLQPMEHIEHRHDLCFAGKE